MSNSMNTNYRTKRSKKSFINKENNHGPKLDPYGTPEIIEY